MTILIIQIFFVALFGGIVKPHSWKSQRANVFMLITFLSMWYVHAMVEPNSMPDLPTYKLVYESIGETRWGDISNHWAHINMELGYLYLNKALSLISLNYTFFMWVFSFLILFPYMYTIKQYSPYVIISVLLLLLIPYNQSLFVLRQHFAVAVCFASIPLIIERRLIVFLIVMALSFFFHRSVLVFITSEASK